MMQWQYLNADDWAAFQHRFPTAALWLSTMGLGREQKSLEAELVTAELDTRRRAWIEKRLAELNGYFDDLNEGAV